MKTPPEILDDINHKKKSLKENTTLLNFSLVGSVVSYILIVIGKETVGYIGGFICLILIWKSNTNKDTLYQAIGLFLIFVSIKVISFFLMPN